MSSVLSPPSKIIKQVNSMIFSFLWNGKDKVTRLSSINSYEDGGIKMTDIESLVKAARLAWLKRSFNDNESTGNSTCYIFYVMLVVFYFLNAIMQ